MSKDAAGAAPWLTWYGDDFTGSAAVMEVLAFASIPTVLFTSIPSDSLRERFADARAIGIASTARSKSPDWMAENLPAPLNWLDGLGAPILHYKVCSTFDSSPESGSIGKAIETALALRPSDAVPMITAAPQMRRYQAFGHLFAGTFDGVFRLDRHPVMARHPVTPMDEADLLVHLARQTDLPSALIDLEMLAGDPQEALETALAAGARILSIDSMEEASETAAGRLLWENRDRLRFVVGSQGVEYALVRHWIASGRLAPAVPAGGAGAVDRIAAVSGSVSLSTARQLAHAGANGFALLAFPATCACGPEEDREAEIHRLIAEGVAAAARGASPLVHSASGPDDPAVAAFRAALSSSSVDPAEANARIGDALGRILDGILRESGIRRAVISGGDTSGYGMARLGLQALVARAPTIPGAAICTGYGESDHDGLEIALKGGQMGSEDFFDWVRSGGGPR
ncbi:four-carbon acid sugar kinase family protein [Tropicimonas sp. IMCC6043]|uniref:four-carbon acid sugar kinase family protein n=1 Tax=Tropicimonas sp. IMCC6043 TaxID=2510645 RepID=UPI00101DF75D|nr:four-carbon acid sugar kinase family protein [Tropicimonas sp. IMCC6043]RYH11588.1 four-carbon acid sugar kinase family protein [Tropicimonas sp. IMCC6043]